MPRARRSQQDSEPPDSSSVFSGSFLGSALPLDAAKILVAGMEPAFFKEGEALWTASTEVKYLAVVHTGLVRMTRNAPQGSEVVVEILGPGDCVGIFAALGYSHYPLNAWAVVDTWCMKVPKLDWRKAWDTSPRLREQVTAQMAPRLLESYDFMATMLCGSVEQRMAQIILKLAAKSSRITGLSHALIADLAHTTVETCIRTTSKWQEKGWLEKGYRSLIVKDQESLRQLLHSPRANSA